MPGMRTHCLTCACALVSRNYDSNGTRVTIRVLSSDGMATKSLSHWTVHLPLLSNGLGRTDEAQESMEKEKNIPERDSSKKTIIVVAIAAALVIGGLFYLLMRQSVASIGTPPRLAAALRPGNPEFEKHKTQIVLDEPEADEATSVLGGLEMTLRTTVRNFTGRTITGLEIKGIVLDHQNQPVKERVMVVLPNAKQSELEPSKTLPVLVRLQGLSDTDDRAQIKMEVAGVTFKP
jgi:predicted secreted protein